MKKTIASIIAGLLLLGNAYAQYQPNDWWTANPAPHAANPKYASEDAVILKDSRYIEYIPDAKNGIVISTVNHRIIKVLTTVGVEAFNKVYIGKRPEQSMEVKARVISPSGKVTELPADKIFEVEEEGRTYKKFALEGVEKGSEIEYLYKQEKDLSLFGYEVYSSKIAPILSASCTIVIPQHLVFTVKGYNGFALEADTALAEKRIYHATATNIQVIENEKYSMPDAFAAHIQYKLSYNLDKGGKDQRLYTWNELAKSVMRNYTTVTDKEDKAVADFLKKLKTPEGAGDEQQIVTLEDYIKSNISVSQMAVGDEAEIIEKIVKNKVASEAGITRLFALCLDARGIAYQLVFPAKRNEIPLDEKLENYRLIDDALFFFPATKQFLAPAHLGLRYPYILPEWAATRGLFLRTVNLNGMRSAFASFDTIPILPYEKSAHNMEISMRFHESLDSIIMQSKQIFTGYGALSYRPAFNFMSKEDANDLAKEMMKSVSKSENIRNLKISNSAMTNVLPNKPLEVEGEIASETLVERAGNKLLVKLGEAIGPQVEMYQERPRQLPVVIDYPHALDRKIVFEIPNGYTVKNPGDLNISVKGDAPYAESMGFVSGYNLQGNKLTIEVHEYYKDVTYPLSVFESFKKVINAAADFNKITLVLEKQ
jgi:hypothetical protein